MKRGEEGVGAELSPRRRPQAAGLGDVDGFARELTVPGAVGCGPRGSHHPRRSA